MSTQQVEVLDGVMKDMVVLGDRLRLGSVVPRTTWKALDEMWESLYEVAEELKKEAS